jgi:ferrous iron transport protein B
MRIMDGIGVSERPLATKYGSRWVAVKLLENDEDILKKVRDPNILDAVHRSVHHLRSIFHDEPEIVMADRRYGFISGACQETIRSSVERRHDVSDMIDAVVTNRILGLPIFLVLMYAVFFLTFTVGKHPMGWLETLFGRAGVTITQHWPTGSAAWLRSLLVDGVIGGVGGVLVFLPNILILFAAIALLEDSGYMARAAFVMDRIMHKIGLHGKSFIPMLIGFGCSVPAIMATRILENRRSRLTTIMVIPLMSCGARLTIYSLFIPAFFDEPWRGPVLWLIYIIGIVLAIVAARLLRLTLFKGETEPFVMELPPYRMPTVKAVLVHTWQRGWMYLRKAGTVILAASILFWVLANYPKPREEALASLNAKDAQQKSLEHSIVGRLGRTIEPALRPLGFDWKIGTALIGALPAKELFVSQMGVVYAMGDAGAEEAAGLGEKLRAAYTPLTGFCVMLFCLISAPCIATVAMTRQESSSWHWALFQFVGLTALAYTITLAVYQVGSLF